MTQNADVSVDTVDATYKEMWSVMHRGSNFSGVETHHLQIVQEALQITTTLLRKNIDYGSSVFEAPLLDPDLPAASAILVRMSDKLRRIQQFVRSSEFQCNESYADCFRDLAGYSILMLVLLSQLGRGE